MTTVIDTVKTHSRFGGSSASRWMNCAGSVALLETVPAKPEGPYAAEGTAAHFVAEQCLKNNVPASDFLDFLYAKPGAADIVVSGNMVDAVKVYLDTVAEEQALTKASELYVEQGFVIDVPTAESGEVFGTNDAMVYHPETGRLRIFDYKHGVGVSVSADDNAQLKFYATGAVFSHPDWMISEIVLTIVQPRARDADDVGQVKDWTFDVVELLEFQGDVEAAIAVAKRLDTRVVSRGDLQSGSWCRWCDAATICPAKEQDALSAATLDMAGVKTIVDLNVDDLPDLKTFDVERISKIVAGLNILTSWANQAQEYLEGLVLSGVEVPGWKAVEKIGRAKWVEDPLQVASYAAMMFDLDDDQVMPRKLVTIGDAEKLLKSAGATKEQVDDFKLKFTIKESSGLTIAPSSDRRPAINAVAADMGSVKL